jgi:hypothetical protein
MEGIRFASRKEAKKYKELSLMVKAGMLVRVDRQVRYPLIVNGDKICVYIADFITYDFEGNRKVIDIKGFLTPVYKIKKKLMKAIYGIDIIEE